MIEDELNDLVLEAIRHATEESIRAYPDGSLHPTILKDTRKGFVRGYMTAWTEAQKGVRA